MPNKIERAVLMHGFWSMRTGARTAGDVNGDGCLDERDGVLINQLVGQYMNRTHETVEPLVPGCFSGDMTGDGRLDGEDLAAWSDQWGNWTRWHLAAERTFQRTWGGRRAVIRAELEDRWGKGVSQAVHWTIRDSSQAAEHYHGGSRLGPFCARDGWVLIEARWDNGGEEISRTVLLP